MSYVVCPENVQKCICHDVASEASNLVSIASKLSAGASWQLVKLIMMEFLEASYEFNGQENIFPTL